MLNAIFQSKATTAIKWVLFVAIGIHSAYLVAGLFLGYLGANPVEAITHITGNYALYFFNCYISRYASA